MRQAPPPRIPTASRTPIPRLCGSPTTRARADTDSVTITVGNTPPTATIDTPAAGTTWTVGDVITFSGHATDPQQGTLPASALTWRLLQQHCPSNCHTHVVQTFAGVASGSFTAPDHEYPSYLELELTATDSGGLTNTKTIRLDPRTVTLTFSSIPGGLQLTVNGTAGSATFTRTVIIGSANTVSAITPQTKGKKTYTLLVMVRRRRPNPQHHRSGHKRHLHSPLQISHGRGGAGPAPPRHRRHLANAAARADRRHGENVAHGGRVGVSTRSRREDLLHNHQGRLASLAAGRPAAGGRKRPSSPAPHLGRDHQDVEKHSLARALTRRTASFAVRRPPSLIGWVRGQGPPGRSWAPH